MNGIEEPPPSATKKRTSHTLLFLYAANSFLFLWLSFFFLPDSLVKVLGSAVGVVLGVFGLKSINPTEDDGAKLSPRQKDVLAGVLSIVALVQVAWLWIGYSNPCQVFALPDSSVYVDGKFFLRTP